MKISFTPMRRAERITLSKSNDVLAVNGEAFDFSPLPEGATLPLDAIDSGWFAGPVERIAGVLHLTLILPHGTNAPRETLFPEPLDLIGDGPVTLPPYETEPPHAD
ncbi:MAG: hypothetical protein RQ806_06505 [Erythrobacter sp.]|nr:hypothetical protein [Erythrobacter sp.]